MKNRKLIGHESLDSTVKQLRSASAKLVFTNGCFDILHPGHIAYLTAARGLGDFLIVGLNSDTSIARLKGSDRPINKLDDRISMLTALESINYIVTFDEDTPVALIHQISPDILVKGGDYQTEQIVGYKHVKSYGGEVLTVPLLEGYSTTAYITKIKAL